MHSILGAASRHGACPAVVARVASCEGPCLSAGMRVDDHVVSVGVVTDAQDKDGWERVDAEVARHSGRELSVAVLRGGKVSLHSVVPHGEQGAGWSLRPGAQEGVVCDTPVRVLYAEPLQGSIEDVLENAKVLVQLSVEGNGRLEQLAALFDVCVLAPADSPALLDIPLPDEVCHGPYSLKETRILT